jgi:hypothetical protein
VVEVTAETTDNGAEIVDQLAGTPAVTTTAVTAAVEATVVEVKTYSATGEEDHQEAVAMTVDLGMTTATVAVIATTCANWSVSKLARVLHHRASRRSPHPISPISFPFSRSLAA